KQDVLLPNDGQEIVFTQDSASFGAMHSVKPVYVDEISGEEIEGYVLRDRQKISQEGLVAIMAEVDATSGKLIGRPDIIIRGFSEKEGDDIKRALFEEMQQKLSGKQGKTTSWVYLRKLIGEIAEKRLYKQFRRRPLILPVVIEV